MLHLLLIDLLVNRRTGIFRTDTNYVTGNLLVNIKIADPAISDSDLYYQTASLFFIYCLKSRFPELLNRLAELYRLLW